MDRDALPVMIGKRGFRQEQGESNLMGKGFETPDLVPQENPRERTRNLLLEASVTGVNFQPERLLGLFELPTLPLSQIGFPGDS